MSAKSLLAGGVLVALAGASIGGRAQPPPPELAFGTRTSASAPRDTARARELTPPAPRGDLRGDIANNARAKPEIERQERSKH